MAKPTAEPAAETTPEVDEQKVSINGRELIAILDRLVAVQELGRYDGRTLDERMAAVQAELEDVPRRGHADVETRSGANYSYDYITEADLMSGIRPLLARHGIATYYSDRLLSLEGNLAQVEVSLTFCAAGEERTLTATGVGTDYGDKAANKAKTSAVRYLLWKTFLQPSDEDPEQENVSQAEAARAAGERTRAAGAARGSTSSGGGGTNRPRLLSRINELAVELDEIQGHSPGTTAAKIPELALAAFAGATTYPDDLSDPALVQIGQQLSRAVTDERVRKEAAPDEYAPIELELVAA